MIVEQQEALDIKIDRALYSKSYPQFFKSAWEQVETDELVFAWYITFICQRLQLAIERVARGEKRHKHIIISICPRTGKSYMVSKFLQAWAWTIAPWLKFISASYSAKLSEDHSIATKSLIEKDWYQKRWPVGLSQEKNTNTLFFNVHGGLRLATSVGGSVTGFGGDILSGDDLLDPYMAYSAAERENVIRWLRAVFFRRLNNKETGLIILMQQRVHENDPVGWLLKNMPEDFEVISIPSEIKYDIAPPTLKENYVNGLMDPRRFSRYVLDNEKKIMLPQDYDAQYGQSPKKVGGNIIKREYFTPYNLREVLDRADVSDTPIIMHFAGDTGYTKNQANSATVFLAGFTFQNKLYLFDRLKVHEEITDIISITIGKETKQGSLQRFVNKCGYGSESLIVIEPKASGLDIINTLRTFTGLNIAAYEFKTTDKVTAVRTVLPMLMSRRVMVPEGATWLEDFYEECEAFSADLTHDKDDQVDTLVMMIKLYLIPNLTSNNAAGTYSSSVKENWDDIELDLD